MDGWLAGWLDATRTLTDAVYDVTYRVRTKQGREGKGTAASFRYVRTYTLWLDGFGAAAATGEFDTGVTESTRRTHSVARLPSAILPFFLPFVRKHYKT